MVTTVKLYDGVLSTRLHDSDEEVIRERWLASLQPAITLLRSLGGGSMLVSHRHFELSDYGSG